MELTITIFEKLLFILFACNTVYVLFFSVAFLLPIKRKKKKSKEAFSRIGVLIPAYREDAVIEETVKACILQNYPKEYFEVVVIADHMKSETIDLLKTYPIKVLELKLEKSTKVKSLNLALEQMQNIDIELILDADNVMKPDFLEKINTAFKVPTTTIVQGHRMAKNTNTTMAYLDAISEEINNSIFRQGHVNAGFSAALIGSGMAFKHDVLKEALSKMDAVGGFDRALELGLLYEGHHIDYVYDAIVLDEKVQNKETFSNQRRRWISSQIHYLKYFTALVPSAVKNRKWDFMNKYIQQMLIPRVMMIGLLFINALGISFYNLDVALKWWILFICFALSLSVAIPKRLYTTQLIVALIDLPFSFLVMFATLFKIRGANKTFIHTPHGIDKSKK